MENTMTEARADALMEDGFHCSQCVFPYAAFRLGMDRDEALRLSAGLGGGCFHGDSCGAVTGAAMALSIVFGFDRPNAEEAAACVEAATASAEIRAGELAAEGLRTKDIAKRLAAEFGISRNDAYEMAVVASDKAR